MRTLITEGSIRMFQKRRQEICWHTSSRPSRCRHRQFVWPPDPDLLFPWTCPKWGLWRTPLAVSSLDWRREINLKCRLIRDNCYLFNFKFHSNKYLHWFKIKNSKSMKCFVRNVSITNLVLQSNDWWFPDENTGNESKQRNSGAQKFPMKLKNINQCAQKMTVVSKNHKQSPSRTQTAYK